MSQLHELRADNRRPAGGTPAITPFPRISTAVAKVTASALCGLVCLAFGSHMIRADTLSGVDGPSALRGLSPLPTGDAPCRSDDVFAAGSGPLDGEETNRYHAANEQTAGPIRPHTAPAMAYLPESAEPQPDLPRPMPSRPIARSLVAESPIRLPSTGVRQVNAVTVEETGVDDNVAQARPEPMQKSPQPKHASPLLQPREMSTTGPERVAFQDPFPGEPIPFSAEPGPMGKESGMPSGACEMDLPPIGDVTANIQPPEGDLPLDCARTKLPQMGQVSPGEPACRQWPQILYPWEATSYCHRPLYFEEVNLERYGYMGCDHRCGGVPAALVQPVLSGAHFFASVPLLPYKMTVDPACECIYTLGHYRPGSPVPHQIHRLPLRPVAGGVEAVAITGLIYAIP